MIILELIAEFFIEVIMIDVTGGTLSKLNNAILKLRGIETKSVEEIKLDKLKKRYEYKNVVLKSNSNELKKGKKGVVLELIDGNNAFVEFEGIEDIVKVPLSEIQLKRQIK
jgi:hypothetical protein